MGPQTLKRIAREFYENLYKAGGARDDAQQKWNFAPVCDSDRQKLNACVTKAEIQKALFQMVPDKAPGPDGFSTGFLQRFRPAVGTVVVRFVQNAFHTGMVPPHANEALICLIPKVASP